jgi:hypothetical protein
VRVERFTSTLHTVACACRRALVTASVTMRRAATSTAARQLTSAYVRGHLDVQIVVRTDEPILQRRN